MISISKALCVLIPSFVIIALSHNQIYFYIGLFLYSYSTAIITSCLNAVVSKYGLYDILIEKNVHIFYLTGDVNEKGVIMGIFRSLGALSRAIGPFVASIGKLMLILYFIKLLMKSDLAYWSCGVEFAYISGGIALVIPLYILFKASSIADKKCT